MELIEKANSFLERHMGLNYNEFLKQYQNGNGVGKDYETKFLTLLSTLEDLENMGFKLEDFSELITKENIPLSPLDLKIKNFLSASSTARNKGFELTTLVSRDLFNEMKKGEMGRKILVGKKYNDLESGIIFDILLNAENFDNLQNIKNTETPTIPYLVFTNTEIVQNELLKLNNQYPEFKKIFGGSKEKNPRFYRLIETDSKEKMFTIGSYKVLD